MENKNEESEHVHSCGDEDCHVNHEKQMPVVNEKKIGRNELCPCGSGKKYKKCCIKI